MSAKAEETLSLRQAAVELGVSLSHAYNLVWAGRLPGAKQDGVWRIPKAAVEARKAALGGRP